MKRRILSFMLAAVLLITGLAGCGGKKGNDGVVSRGEWMRMLTLEFGMYTYDTEEPYYSDVDEEDEYFAPVQIAGDWGILDGEGKFEAGKDATKGFIAETLADTMGLDGKAGTSVKAEGGYDENKIGLLADKNIINVKNGKFDSGKTMDREECSELLVKAYQVWCKKSFPNKYANVEIKAGVQDLREEKELEYKEEPVEDADIEGQEDAENGVGESENAQSPDAGDGQGQTSAGRQSSDGPGAAPDGGQENSGGQGQNNDSRENSGGQEQNGGSQVQNSGSQSQDSAGQSGSSTGGTNGQVTKVTVPDSVGAELTPGSVFILPANEENPDGVAYKVKNVEKTEDGSTIIYAETPNLEDLFEKIELQGDYTPDYDNVQVEEGVTFTIESGMASQPGYVNTSAESTSQWPDTPAQYADLLKKTMENQDMEQGRTEGSSIEENGEGGYAPLVYYEGMENFDQAATKDLGDAINFEWDNGKGMTYQFKVGDISLSSDIDIQCVPMNVKRAYLRLDYKIINQLNYKTHSDNKLGKVDAVTEEKKLGTFDIPIQMGFKVTVDVVGRITIDGELEVSLNCTGACGLEIINNHVRAIKDFTYKPTVRAEATVKLTGDLSVNLEHSLLKSGKKFLRILGAGAQIGPAVNVNADFVKNCFDMKGYIEGSIYVLSDFKIGRLQLNWNQAFWTENNTPYKITAHMEDWKLVPKCTRDGLETENKEEEVPSISDPLPDEGNNGSSGRDEGRDKNQSGDNGEDIVLSSYNIFLSPGQTDKIKLSIQDARFESENTKIASVGSDGVVTGVAEGSTIINIYDKDGSLAASIAVQVD